MKDCSYQIKDYKWKESIFRSVNSSIFVDIRKKIDHHRMMRLPLLSFLLLFAPLAASAQVDFETYDQTVVGTSVSFKMVAIPSGTFMMGSPASDRFREPDEGPQKKVEVSPFWMSEHELTFAEWDAFFKDVTIPQGKTVDGITRPTPQYIDLTWGMGRDGKQPTNSMSQQAAIMYCQWLYSKTGYFFRLPTEAEWEYACKAGSSSSYPLGTDANSLTQAGYFRDNSQGKFHKVMQKEKNAFGLYDMLGNLSEWTLDQYDPAFYSKSQAKNPLAPPVTKYPRTVRGGSYLDDSKELRCTNRIASDAKWNQRDPQIPKSRWWLTDAMFVGFRVVRPVDQPTKQEIEDFYLRHLK